MQRTLNLTLLVLPEDGLFSALCPELDIASQGESVEEARSNLREALDLFLEVAEDEEIERRLAAGPYVSRIEIDVA